MDSKQPSSLELSLDPSLQLWVLLPITLATLLMAVLRRNIVPLLTIDERTNVLKITDANNLKRSAKLRQNSGYISKNQFEMRRLYFVRKGGPFDKEKSSKTSSESSSIPVSPITAFLSPDSLANQAVSIIFTVLPQMFLGTWASSTFKGLIICRLPFTLTPRFRSMLQSGVEHAVQNLDVSYVSSLSWYILNLFGNSALLSLITSPNQADNILPSISNQLSMSLNPNKVYHNEKEILLSMKQKDVKERLVQTYLNTKPEDFVSL